MCNPKNVCVMTFNIQIPFFPGFYESDLMNSDTSYWAIKEELEYYQRDYCEYGPGEPEEKPLYEQLTEDDLDFRYSDYEHDVAENFLEAWKYYAPEIVENAENPQIDSPRYYNFRNDELFADVELREDWQDVMRHFIAENYDWLQNRVHEDWTSYDGFMSFMDNDLDEWPAHLFDEQDVRYISTMLAYMMYRENKEIRNDLVMIALEDIYAGSYVFLTDEGKAKVEAGIEDGSVKVYDPAQLKLPFED